MTTDVLIVGANGMLGHMVEHLLRNEGLTVASTARKKTSSISIEFDVNHDSIAETVQIVKPRYIVNAIGIIKSRIVDSDTDSIRDAIRVNGLFPFDLAAAAASENAHVIQIATDCVYSGTKSRYDETMDHDPVDVYGKSKSLGEVPASNVLHLRASIIGPETGRSTSLWEWVRSQNKSAQVNGYTNHHWNGVTTFHFAKVVNAIIQQGLKTSGVRHLVPSGTITKAALVREIATASGRNDLVVNDFETPVAIDRTLSTMYESFNSDLWRMAGYEVPPTIPEMVRKTPLD